MGLWIYVEQEWAMAGGGPKVERWTIEKGEIEKAAGEAA